MATRTITAKSTIPAGTAGTGTVTAMAGDNSILQVTGGVLADFEKFSNGHRDVWIYAVTEAKLARITGFNRIGTSTTFMVYCDRVMPFVFNNAFTIIIANLISYSVKNNGAADGVVDGGVLEPDDAVNEPVIHNPGNGIAEQYDAITVDGTGTSLVIEEAR